MSSAFFKQPKSLYLLGFLEAWDRLTFYGIQSILILYLLKVFVFNYNQAYTTFGIYSSLSFGMPLAGGYLADRLLKQTHAITLGAIMMILGCLFLLFGSSFSFFFGLSTLIMGIGLFKPNITTQVNHLYHHDDPLREAGSTVFYTMTNIGSILGPIIYGVVAIHYGWHIGFIISAIGMGISLLTYIAQRKRLPSPARHQSKRPGWLNVVFCYTALALALAIFTSIFYSHLLFNIVAWAFLIAVVVILTLSAYSQSQPERKRLIAFVLLNLFSVVYYTCYMQTASSLLLYIHHYVNTTIFGLTIPANTFVSLEPSFIVILTAILAPLWLHMAKKQGHHTIIPRTLISMLITAVAFVVFAISGYLIHTSGTINWPMLLIIIGNALLAVGELAIGPALIASVSYLAPSKQQSTYVGLWLLGCAFSGYIASWVAKLTAWHNVQNLNNYTSVFWSIALVVTLFAVVLVALQPYLKSLFPKNSQTA